MLEIDRPMNQTKTVTTCFAEDAWLDTTKNGQDERTTSALQQSDEKRQHEPPTDRGRIWHSLHRMLEVVSLDLWWVQQYVIHRKSTVMELAAEMASTYHYGTAPKRPWSLYLEFIFDRFFLNRGKSHCFHCHMCPCNIIIVFTCAQNKLAYRQQQEYRLGLELCHLGGSQPAEPWPHHGERGVSSVHLWQISFDVQLQIQSVTWRF